MNFTNMPAIIDYGIAIGVLAGFAALIVIGLTAGKTGATK